MEEIATDELTEKLGNPGIKIIDIRPADAYNGWALQNEFRSGHIAGAKSLPFRWTNYMDWIEMVRKKEILPEQEIVIYGYTLDEVDGAARQFQKSGFNHIRLYYHFLTQLANYTS